MICVSIARGRHKQAMAEHRHLVEQGAQLVELRVDYIRREVSLKRLLKDRPCPMIITCRRKQDQGRWEGTEEARQILLRAAIAEGVEYVDLEEDIAGKIPRYGKTQRIVSLHNFRETPQDLDAIYERLAQLDPDIIKIATMAHEQHDNLRMLQLVRRAEIPTVGICMGEVGMPSRILAGRFGSPFTYATFHQERALAPGQLSYRQMKDIYHYDRIDQETEIFGVVADPVGHSLSPVIHNAAFRAAESNRVYVPFRVPREGLKAFLDDHEAWGLKGLSVTIPHKESIIQWLDQYDAATRGIQACNTVLLGDQRVGYNTDYRAALRCLTRALGTNAEKPLEGKRVLLLGAGGVSRAIAYGIAEQNAKLMVASRTYEKAEQLAVEYNGEAVLWEDRQSREVDIVVNGTPVGMHPNVDESPLEIDFLKRNMIVFDTVYNPEQTLLIKHARNRECKVVTGVEMFVRQAAMQYKLFTGDDAPKELMRAEVKRAIGAARY